MDQNRITTYMKTLQLLALGFALPVAALAQFTPISDDFSTTGALVGSTPDAGLGAWTQITNSTPALSVASGTLALAASSGEAAQLNFASGNLSGGSIYMGWDFTVASSGSISTSDTIQAVAGFRSGTAATGVFELSFGVFRPSGNAQSTSGAPSTTTSQFAVGLFTGTSFNASSGNLAEWSVSLNRGAQYRAVLGVDLDGDEARLWIAPASAESPSIALSTTASLRGVFFRQGGASHGAVAIDNLVVSQSFAAAAATAVPEPGAFALVAGLAAMALSFGGRRRARS